MNYHDIEQRWQEYWKENKTYKFDLNDSKPLMYALEMFSYPSGAALHMGHWYNFGPADTWVRYKRMQGYNVFHPMGFDAFGLPAENYAIKTGIHPSVKTYESIAVMEKQLQAIGTTIDWDYEVITSDESYYKWTQWIFGELYKKGLAYKKYAPVNYCPKCNTVLANEQVVNGACERCGTLVIRKKLSQWFFKITDYAEELLNDLDKLDWPERTKNLQRNWIGKSEGANVTFKIKDSDLTFDVFTTRVDTLYGCTYCVFAPENEQVLQIVQDDYKDKVEAYISETNKLSEIDRMSTVKEKTGVFTGSYAINPINGREVPIWIADYVIASYGTGAVMAVPAHDERDAEFATKFNLEIIDVVSPYVVGAGNETPRTDVKTIARPVIDAIICNSKGQYLLLEEGTNIYFVGGGTDGEDDETAIYRETLEETGYDHIKSVRPVSSVMTALGFKERKNVNEETTGRFYEVVLEDEHQVKCEVDDGKHTLKWVNKDQVKDMLTRGHHKLAWEQYINGKLYFTEQGFSINSEDLSGLKTTDMKSKVVAKLKKMNMGSLVTTYKLRDWLVSRQRYWGAPIPVVYCEKCGEVLVPEAELPVKLPTDVDFKPEGKSPLASSETFMNTTCPKCGGPALRDPDTLDTFVCSSWYFLRYPDNKNEVKAFSKDIVNKLLPVDKYVGGVEHACMHLLYSRFFVKALRDMGHLSFDEPFMSLVHQGIILGSDGEKMSKSKGNTVAPDELINKYGSDVLRTYLMFGFNYIDGGPWTSDGIKAIDKFFNKADRLFEKIIDQKIEIKELEVLLHRAIKNIDIDIERFQFNTCISRIMEYVNGMSKQDIIPAYYLEQLALLLAPFAPHLAEEWWFTKLNKTASIHAARYPLYDKSKLEKDTFILVIQVNGKVRGNIELDNNATEDEIKEKALLVPNIQKLVEDKQIIKTIIVPKKIINIVIK